MTSSHQSEPEKPATVELCEYAVGAGLVGQNLAVEFCDYPPMIVCELWKRTSQMVSNKVCQIRTRSDIRKLEKYMSYCRLALVQEPAQFERTAWAIEMSDSSIASSPCLFGRSMPDCSRNLPAPLLRLQSSPCEERSLVRWLGGRASNLLQFPESGLDTFLEFAPELIGLTEIINSGPKAWNDRRILKGLLYGAGVCSFCQSPSSMNASIGIAEYESVRRLLQSSTVCGGANHVNSLAITMVRRANVYLQLKIGTESIPGLDALNNPGDPLHHVRGSRTNKDLITRRELADLGNVRSSLVRNIVETLGENPDGFQWFQKMGLKRSSVSQQQWGNLRLSARLSLLRPWSYKQIRTHFDVLRREGLITGEREHANGPWQYELPEEFSNSTSPFGWLPATAELFQRAAHNG